jgi:hypothetical protein
MGVGMEAVTAEAMDSAAAAMDSTAAAVDSAAAMGSTVEAVGSTVEAVGSTAEVMDTMVEVMGTTAEVMDTMAETIGIMATTEDTADTTGIVDTTDIMVAGGRGSTALVGVIRGTPGIRAMDIPITGPITIRPMATRTGATMAAITAALTTEIGMPPVQE